MSAADSRELDVSEPATAPPSTDAPTVEAAAPPARRRWRSPARPAAIAALVVLPYLLLMISWAFANPPNAAPDEKDHLIKAIGMARLNVGAPYTGAPSQDTPASRRNASITRVIPIPARLVINGYDCEIFHSTRPADCLPSGPAPGSGLVPASASVGSYPPFLYLPIGLAARATGTPAHAFLAGRLVCVAMATVLLLMGTWHLVRWLGRAALLGAFVGLTPMAVFSSSVVSTSGAEICGAFAVASVGVVATRRPDSLRHPATLGVLAVAGGALILSRQLGVVTFAAIVVLLLARAGRPLWALARRPRPVFGATVAVLVGCAAAVYWWERGHDHPNQIGPLFDAAALQKFSSLGYAVVKSGIGQFGWLDVPLYRWAVGAWIVLAVVLIGVAVLFGDTADRWTLLGWLVATWAVAFAAYATVFFRIDANVQGRHMLPFFMLVPLLTGVVLVERLGRVAMPVLRRVIAAVALVMPALQLLGLYINDRRYAVGSNGPLWFAGAAKWHPVLGWAPWTLLAVLGTTLLAVVILWCRPGPFPEEVPSDVAR